MTIRNRIFFLAALFTLPFGWTALRAQSPADTLRVVNWNLEWWADGSTHNATTQVARTQQLMTAIGADIYALQEVVDNDSLLRLAQRLGNGPWGCVISPYGSGAASPAATGYKSAQKLALLYRTAVFRNVSTRPFLKGNPYSYYDFSSGRYPFWVQGEARTRAGSWQRITFLVLHAKAQSDDVSCQRRESGAFTLKDSLDQRMPGERFLLLGDFNDALNKTICSTGGVSAYKNFVDDSSDAVSYRSLTLPLARAGISSVDGYSSLIDNVVASDEMALAYVPGSAQSLRNFVRAIVPSYVKDVSDHYPIQTKYVLDGPGSTAVPEPVVAPLLQLVPGRAGESITVTGTGAIRQCAVYDELGRTILTAGPGNLPLQLQTGGWQPGLYVLRAVLSDGQTWTGRFLNRP